MTPCRNGTRAHVTRASGLRHGFARARVAHGAGHGSSRRSSRSRDASKPSIRNIAPAAAAAAPAGIRPTSSAPLDLDAARRRLALDRAHDLVEGRRLPVLDVHAHLRLARRGRSSPSARTPGKPPSRSRTTRAISRAASTLAPARLTLNAMSGRPRADDHARRPTDRSRGGPKSGASSPASIRRCSSPARPGGRTPGRALRRRRRRGRPGSPSSPPTRRASSSAVLRARCASSGRTGTTGTTSAAPIRGCTPACARRSMRSRAHAIAARSASTISSLAADEGEHRAVVVDVGVHVEELRTLGERARRSPSTTAASRPSEKFGTASSGSAICSRDTARTPRDDTAADEPERMPR